MKNALTILAVSLMFLALAAPLWIISGVALESRQPTPYPLAQPTATYRTAPGWDDLRVEPVARTTGANAPAFNLWYGNTRCYDFDDSANEKEIFFTAQMPHAWRLGSAVHPHVHWVGNSTVNNGDVTWVMEYTWAAPLTGVFTATTSIITGTLKETGIATTTQYLHNITELGIITPTTNSNNVSTVMMARLKRASTQTSDTYNSGTACLLYIDLHYINDSPSGSISEYLK